MTHRREEDFDLVVKGTFLEFVRRFSRASSILVSEILWHEAACKEASVAKSFFTSMLEATGIALTFTQYFDVLAFSALKGSASIAKDKN